jgi:hypothetical protein
VSCEYIVQSEGYEIKKTLEVAEVKDPPTSKEQLHSSEASSDKKNMNLTQEKLSKIHVVESNITE